VTAALLLAAPAAAEERVHLSAPLHFVPGDPSLAAYSPGATGAGRVRFGVAAEYARAPLALVSPDQHQRVLVESQLWLHAGASLALGHRFLAALNVPLLLSQSGESAPFDASLPAASGGGALGDPRLMLRGRVLGEADAFALGVGVTASAPLATDTYAGSAGATVQPFAAVGHEDRAGFSALQLGFSWRRSQTLPGILPTRLGSALDLGLGAGVVLDRAQRTRLGPELSASFVLANGARLLDARSTSCVLLLHLQHRLLDGPVVIGAALGPGIGRAPGAADYRALFSLALTPEIPVPPPDGDDDSIPDSSDMCPTLRGEPSNDALMHGCPPAPSDADGDGVPDTMDACPRTPGQPSNQRTRHGCPPAQDRDRDQVADGEDACPDVPGLPSADAASSGCPKPGPAATLEASAIVISEQIQFETSTSQLRPESERVLGEVSNILKEHRELELCEIAGHTDDTGTAELNQRLSEDRALAVLEWLVSQGVERQRLVSRGYGASRPLADNASEAGRTKNRRVEFVILRRAQPEAAKP
jgi:outer membrane protein OmpA-like peptidoglycan-associated protein